MQPSPGNKLNSLRSNRLELYMSASLPAIASIFSNAKPKAAMHIPHPKSCWESLQAGTIFLVSSGLNLGSTPSLCSKIQVWFDEQLAGTYKNSYNVDFKSSLIIEVLQKVGYIPLYSFAQKKRVYLNQSGKICQWVTVQQLLPLEDHSPRPKLSKP